jgi:phosphoglucomutase
VSGDGRFYNKEALQVIIKMAAAQGCTKVWVGNGGLLSTPAASAIIRTREGGFKTFGAFILSASHNPGGIDEDFGIKFNSENGGPAPEKMTDAFFEKTKTISEVKICKDLPDIDISKNGSTSISSADGSKNFVVDVFDCVEDHERVLSECFDFDAIKALMARDDFTMCYDSMHGVQGPYAKRILVDVLGADRSYLINADPKEDFNGIHADPNLTYAKDLTKVMGVDKKGRPVMGQENGVPSFGAAADGDADRNMILGSRFFVSPSDSLAIICANATCIPAFKEGLKGLARSMPTSAAVDRVAKKLGIPHFEVPTGWKFFCNLMDSKAVFGKTDYTPFICGEESFGTGANHVREKDGMWAVLAWLSIIAHKNQDASKPLVTVEEITKAHWSEYGRNYYCRYDYEGVDKPKALEMMAAIVNNTWAAGMEIEGFKLDKVDEFEYHDPIDGSISSHQGIRIIFTDGSRIVFRLSGTGVVGATIRMYLEKYEPNTGELFLETAKALENLVAAALDLSKIKEFTGRDEPTVIT